MTIGPLPVGEAFLGFDSNAQVGMPSDQVTKINGDGQGRPAVGTPPAGLASVSFSIVIPAGATVNLSSVSWDWRKATGGGNARWLAFRTSLDANLTFSEFGVARNAFESADIDLSGAAYQGLTDTTVTFHWYAGGEGSGDIDFDTVIIDGEVGNAAANPPNVINAAPSGIAPTSATIGGEVTDTGGANPAVTIYWGDNDGGTAAGSWDKPSTWDAGRRLLFGDHQLDPFDELFLPLLRQQQRRRRLGGLHRHLLHGAPPDPPTVINTAATNVTFTDADLNGEVTATGGESPNVTIYFGDNDGGTTAGDWDDAVVSGRSPVPLPTVRSPWPTTRPTTSVPLRRTPAALPGRRRARASPPPPIRCRSSPTAPRTGITGTAAQVGGEVHRHRRRPARDHDLLWR